jgi:hypothetical protein
MSKKVNETQQALSEFVYKLKNATNCQLPCVVKAVKGNFVDCLVIRNDEEENIIFPNIPIRHMETLRAYVFLGVKAGDPGVIRYFDKSIEEYKSTGTQEFNRDTRQHSLSDGLYELGFIPQNKAYTYPAGSEIEIGLKDKSAKINFTGGTISIVCQTANVSAKEECNVVAPVVNVKSPQTNLGEGGLPIARETDSVVALDGTTVIGSILKGGVNTSI